MCLSLLHVVSYVSQWQSLLAISAAEVPHSYSLFLSGCLSLFQSDLIPPPCQYSYSKSIDRSQIHLLTAFVLLRVGVCWCFGVRVCVWGRLSLMPASVTLLILIQPGLVFALFLCVSLMSITKSKKQELGVAILGF